MYNGICNNHPPLPTREEMPEAEMYIMFGSSHNLSSSSPPPLTMSVQARGTDFSTAPDRNANVMHAL